LEKGIRPVHIELKVNRNSVELTEFVASFIDGAAGGLITSLKGIEIYSSYTVHMTDRRLDITVDGAQLTVNAFVENLVRNTITGMVLRLKSVESVDELELKVEVVT